jgi:hypothetical protein
MLKSEMKKLALVLAIIWILIYFLSYFAYRQTHLQVWEKDQKEYVMFTENKVYLYYFFRPLSWIEAVLTGMNFHLGPHS